MASAGEESSDDLREFIAAVQQAEVDARTCHENSERRRAQLQGSLVLEDKAGPSGKVSAYSSDDATSLQNGCGSYASSIETDRQLRAAQRMEEQQFQNLREKRAALEDKLQKLSISLRGDGRIAKRARNQLTQKVWNWLNSAFQPSIGVHLGPDHIDAVAMSEEQPAVSGEAEPASAGADINHRSCSLGDVGLLAQDTVGAFNDMESRGTRLSTGVDCVGSPEGSLLSDRKGPVLTSTCAAANQSELDGKRAVILNGTSFPCASSPGPVDGENHVGLGVPEANGELTASCGKRKAPVTADLQWEASWLSQAEAAQAVLASSHEVLQSSRSVGLPTPQQLAPDGKGASSGDPTPSGFLSSTVGAATFIMGKGSEAPDKCS